MIQAAGLEPRIRVTGQPRELPADVERNLLRIAHEAVTNAVRPAPIPFILIAAFIVSGVISIFALRGMREEVATKLSKVSRDDIDQAAADDLD